MKRRAFIVNTAFSAAWLSTAGCHSLFNQSKEEQNKVGYVFEDERELPVVGFIDLLVVGGSTAAVSAAVAASGKGAKTILLTPYHYLGEDICGTMNLQLPDSVSAAHPLIHEIFNSDKRTTPLKTKKALENALLEAGVQSVYGCFASEILFDNNKKPAGIAFANKAGRQAVIAKIIIDATGMATVTRTAGAKACPLIAKKQLFTRNVLIPDGDHHYKTNHHELEINMPDNSFASFARAEQLARDKTYRHGQLRASDFLSFVPKDPIICQKKSTAWEKTKKPDINHFIPEGFDNIYVLSGYADIPRDEARKAIQPCGLVQAGNVLGNSVAKKANSMPDPEGSYVNINASQKSNIKGGLKENLKGLRPTDSGLPIVYSQGMALPVLGRYDVAVAGGGTSGAAAAIGAARKGADTLLVEYFEGLGGTGTLGMITKPYHGRNVGFATEVPFTPGGEYNIEDKMEWYRRQAKDAGADIWFGVMCCGAFVENGKVKGIVVATPFSRGVILANTVIDSTSNAYIAIAAGAEYMYGANEKEIALQGTGFSPRPLFDFHYNSDYLLVDEADMIDVNRAFIGARKTMNNKYFDSSNFIDNRERRRIVGDYVLKYLDQVLERKHTDTIVFSASDYDSHGYPSQPYFALLPHDRESRKENHPAPGGTSYTPYRCLLPKGLDNILVTGLSISMERDASAMVRMQHDLANQGYAAGVAAAMAAEQNITVRGINIKELQKYLIDKELLPPEILKHKDTFPLSTKTIKEAVEAYPKATDPQSGGRPLAIIMSHHKQALPLLKDAWKNSAGSTRLAYAKILGVLGNKDVVPELIEATENITSWDDKILQGGMAEYAHLPTPIDGLILALGYTKDKRALPAIQKKLASLDASVTLSHHRSVALALENIDNPQSAESIAGLLKKPGMRGFTMQEIEPLYNKKRQKRKRTEPLREIVWARALYRCGDYQGMGKAILSSYCSDIRGLFARHAKAVLEKGTNYQT